MERQCSSPSEGKENVLMEWNCVSRNPQRGHEADSISILQMRK